MKKQKASTSVYYLILAFLLSASSLKAQNSNVSESVKISGLVKNSFIISAKNLKGFKTHEVNLHKDSSTSSSVKNIFTGILLKDILDSAKVNLPTKKSRGEFIVYIKATDGYKVVYAYNELYYGPAALNTWLVFQKNGEDLLSDGRFVIHCASDSVSGPRHVKWVQSIEIKRVE